MNYAYHRAMKNAPSLLKEGHVISAVDALARALASVSSELLLRDLPNDPTSTEISQLIDAGVSESATQMHVLLGWAAGHVEVDPVEFDQIHLVTFEKIFRDQLAAGIEHVLESRSEAQQDETTQSIRAFFLGSEAMADFVNEHCVGEAPWSAVLDASGNLIVSDPARSVFYNVAPSSDGFKASVFDDVMSAIDPESEDATELGSAQTVEEAFALVLAHSELSPSQPTPGA